MGLFAADLRALANLALLPLGRRSLFGAGIGLVLLAVISWWFAHTVLDHPNLRWHLLRGHRDPLLGLLGHGLMACPLVATWLGLSLAQRQLFDSPELLLWRQAPIARWRPAMQVLLRAGFTSSCWAAALAAPFLVAVLRFHDAAPLGYAMLPVAIVGATLPLLAILLAVQIVLMRFFAGRWLRLLLATAGALASVGFSTWLLMTLFRSPEARLRSVASAADTAHELPLPIELGAQLIADASRGQWSTPLLGQAGLWFLAILLGFRLVAHLHPGAHERHLAAEPPLWRRRGARWPASAARTVRNKELAQVLQQPGALVSFLVFGVLVFALSRQQVLVGSLLGDRSLPAEFAVYGALCGLWFLAVLLVLYAHMGRLVLWDSAQWSLYVVSPVAPGTLLRGKLVAIGLLLLWPLLLVGAAGVAVLGAEGRVLLAYAGTAVGGTLAALGVLAVVGTLPMLLRPDPDGRTAPGGRSFVAALVLVVAFQATMVPAVFAWSVYVVPTAERLDELGWNELGGLVAAAVGYGALVVLLGGLVGSRNLRRLLRPV